MQAAMPLQKPLSQSQLIWPLGQASLSVVELEPSVPLVSVPVVLVEVSVVPSVRVVPGEGSVTVTGWVLLEVSVTVVGSVVEPVVGSDSVVVGTTVVGVGVLGLLVVD